ncbi:hypothetical protein B0H16DRAFT_1885377 [Mycena metata]|uniref:NB-ARC domain-containing protein n=1 Tax=Mycena metata TaxID=1033252 RepID=A0AAD7J6U8_9AGAR|nr:hypothetical protein B0H16DRAFT_1885377 [Mycena metata]
MKTVTDSSPQVAGNTVNEDMAPVPTTRVSNITASLADVVSLLGKLDEACDTPFLSVISATTLSLIACVREAKRNKEESMHLMENIPDLLQVVVALHINAEPAGCLAPRTLEAVGEFTKTLHMIHSFVEAQQDTVGKKLKHFLKPNEMNTMLKECRVGLDRARDVFGLIVGVQLLNNGEERKLEMDKMHDEVLELVSALTDNSVSDGWSMRTKVSGTSSNSLSILPAEPKIFHGRAAELEAVVELFRQGSPRIAILGGGGMGKTSLAKAVLHDPEVSARYERRFFVATDSASTRPELLQLVASHIGLRPTKDLDTVMKASLARPALPSVEEFMSRVVEVPGLALMITMRGAERPAKVHWTHPFLPPLKQLPISAAQQTFIDIADSFHPSNEVEQLLRLTDYMPLAVNLIAHLVDYEGSSAVLARWENEKISLLSAGHDKRTNLEASIQISLSSSRLTSQPGAKDLLALLSILPDGLSDVELLQMNLPIQNIRAARSTLLSTCLAYVDEGKRLKVLGPIREHVQKSSPPSPSLLLSPREYFGQLLNLHSRYWGTDNPAGQSNRLASNLANIHQTFQRELHAGNPDLAQAVRYVLQYSFFRHIHGYGYTDLLPQVELLLPQACDDRIEIEYITRVFQSYMYYPVSEPELLVKQGLELLPNLTDPEYKCQFYRALGCYYCYHRNNFALSKQFLAKALTAANSAGLIDSAIKVLISSAETEGIQGNYSAANQYAQEARKLANLSGGLYAEAQALFNIAAAPLDCNLTHRILMLDRARDLLRLCNMAGASLDHNILTMMALAHLDKTEHVEAKAIYTDVLLRTSAEQDPFNHVCCLINLVAIEIHTRTGQMEDHTRQALGRASSIFQTLHYPPGGILCDMVMSDLQLNDGDVAGAYAKLKQCVSSSWGKDASVVSGCLNRLADVKRWPLDGTQRTWTWTITYLAWAQKTNDIIASHWALCFLGDYLLADEEEETAQNIFAAVLDGFTHMDIHEGRAHCMLRLGDMLERQGQRFMAAELWTVARTLFKRSMQEKNVAEIDARFAEHSLEQESLEQKEVGAPVLGDQNRVPVLGS